MQNHISIRRRGWFGRIPSLLLIGFSVFSFLVSYTVTSTGRTSGPISTIYIYVIRRISMQECAIGGCIDTAPHLGVKSPQIPKFESVSRHFSAKRAKYSKFHCKNYSFDFNQFCQMKRPPSRLLLVDCPKMCPTNPRWRIGAILKNKTVTSQSAGKIC